MVETIHEGFSEARIEIYFDVHQPVELVTLTLALQGVARDYRRFLNDQIRESGAKFADEDVTLYVTRVESNCILAELASAASVMGAFFHSTTIRAFLPNTCKILAPLRNIP